MVWTDILASLKSWVKTKAVAPTLAEIIVNNMNDWRNNHPPREQQEQNLEVEEATTQQARLGWKAFLKGCLFPH